jgi:hypothetical protein
MQELSFPQTNGGFTQPEYLQRSQLAPVARNAADYPDAFLRCPAFMFTTSTANANAIAK